jgi:hypothetical protein
MDPELKKRLADSLQGTPSRIGEAIRHRAVEIPLESLKVIDLPAMRSSAQMHAESVQAAIQSHITHLQNSLAEDEELMILCSDGFSQIRVTEIGFHNWHIVIFAGVDGNGNPSSMITNINSVQMTCHVVKVEPPGKPFRVGFVPAGE